MSKTSQVKEPTLDREGRRIGKSGGWTLLAGVVIASPGIVMLVVGLSTGHTWLWAVGLAVMGIASVPAVIGIGLLLSSLVSRWHARHRLFA